MKGSVYKRCTTCGRTVKGRRCDRCPSAGISWSYRVDVGRDADGQRLERRRGGFETKREAERQLAETVASLNSGTFVPSKPTTVTEYLRDEWLEATAPPQVGYETWDDRRRNLGHHVIPHLGDLRLQDVNASHLTRLYAHLMKEGRVDGGGGLSPTTVRRIHAILRKAFNDAVRWGVLQSNPTEFADPPPARVVKAARRRSMRTWNRDELRAFLDGTREHPLHALWMLAATTGMRRSELLGLRWPNLDLDAGTVLVRNTVVLEEDGYELADAQKSTRSGRTIHLDHRTVARLREHRAELEAIAEATGPDWNHHDLVFPTPEGTWWNPPAVSLAFRRAVRSLGLRAVRFHDVRHSHASLLLRAGVNPKVVSERLGHSSVAFTLDSYAHVMPGMQPEAAERFSDLVFDDDARDDVHEEPADRRPDEPTEREADDAEEDPDETAA